MNMNNTSPSDSTVDSYPAEPGLNGAHLSYEELRAAQRAALNLMEDALEAHRRAEALNGELQRENAARARIEEALRASENQMRLVTDNLPVFIVYCDADERYRFVNQPYAARFGLRPDDLLGRRIEDIVGGPAYAGLRLYIDAVLAGRTVEFEQAEPLEQGTRTMRCAYLPDLDGDGKARGFYAMINDVTAQKRAEEQMAQLAAIVTSSSDAIISFSPDERIVTWNRAAEELFGWSASEALGQPKRLFIPPERWEESARLIATVKRGEAIRRFVTVRRRKDNTLVDVSVTLSPVRVNGEFVAISEIVRDVSESRRNTERLAERSRLLDLSNDAIIMRDGRDRIAYWNHGAEAMYGWTRDEALGKNLYELLHTEFLSDGGAAARLPWANGRWDGELRQRRRDGAEIIVAARLVLDSQGQGVTVLETHNDITARKRGERERREREWFIQNLLSTVPSVIYVYNIAQGKNIFISPQLGSALGYSDADLVTMEGDLGRLLMHPDDQARFADHLQRMAQLADGASAEFEYRMKHKSGAWRWYLRRDRVFRRSPAQAVEEILGAATDITERKQWESELQFQKELLQTVTDNAPSMLFMIDAQGRTTFANRAAAELTGFTTDEVLGQVLHDKIHFRRPDGSAYPPSEGSLAGLAPVLSRLNDHEDMLARKDGSWMPVRASSSLLIRDGVISGAVLEVQDISREKQAAAALRESEARFRALADSAPVLIWLSEADGNLFVNRAYREFVGVGPDQDLAHGYWMGFVHPQDRDAYRGAFARNFEQRARFEAEFRFLRYDGQYRWMSSVGTPRLTDDGVFLGYAGCLFDIHDSKMAVQTLQDSEERLRLALESAGAGMWDLDLQSGSMLWSPENCRLYGLEPQGYAPEYKTWRASVHADDIEQVEAHREQTVRAGERYQAEYRIRKPSGEVRWLASQGKAFHDEHGKPVRMLGINIDITERRRIEEERVKFQALVESSLDYIGIADLDDNCFYLNPAGRLLLGIDSEEEVRQCRPEDFVADVDRPFYANTVMPMLRQHGRWEGDGKLKHQKTGAAIDVHRTLFVVKHPDTGAPLCIGTVSRDLRRQKHLERLLTQRVEQLHEADRAKDQFLALLAHELRNPLAPITNAVALIKRKAPVNATLRWCLEVIDGQLGQMSRILEDLVDVSRITRGKLELRLAATDLVPVVQSAIETSRPLIESNRHELTVDLPEAPIWLAGDAARLSQVVANLLNNAAKYTEPGGRIGLSVKASSAGAEIRVTDNGHGISAEMLPRIFDMFTQGEAKAPSGLGVGLTLAKSLVEMHGGRLEARSAGRGQGSEFVIQLPTTAAQDTPMSAGPGAGAAARPPRRLRILVVDDNGEQAATLGALLTSQGHEVRVAGDSFSALEMIADFVPEVGLIDIGMLEMDGCELARRMRTDGRLRDTVLIAQTGWGRESDRLRTEAAGFNHHLVKPINHALLESILVEIGNRPGV